MNNKSKVITAILSILIIVLYFVNEKNDYKFDEASKAYQIYLDGKEIGLIKDENELYSLINKEQQNIKDQYGVDYVYPPDGLDIVETKTFDENYMGVEEIYEKIENADDFTIKGYIITIKGEDKEKQNIVINVLDKKVFEDSLKKYVLSFVTEDELNNYNNGNRSINEIGSIIENMYFNETITIKEGYVSVKNKIYTDSESLSQYLLFGPDAKMDTYTVKSGDSIASISEDNKMNPQEFLIANPKYKSEDAMLAVGSLVNITIINPIITLTYSVYEINENITPYTTENPVVDNTKEPSYKELTRVGVNGITLIHSTYEVINGERSTGVEIKDRKVIREMVQEQYTIGRRAGGYYYPTSGWGYPTEYPFVITSPFQWRWGKHHDGIDISGTGYRSRIFAVAPGTVVEVGYRSTDGNFVIIEHENNIYTQYAHMYQALVVEGQTVKKGDQIGEMGNTGYVLPAPSKYNPIAGWCINWLAIPWSVFIPKSNEVYKVLMKVVVLSSGSKGNVTYLEINNKKFLLDAGRNYKYINENLKDIGVDVKDIDYVVITHNHKDHVSALKTLLAKTGAALIVSEKMFYSIEDVKDYKHIIVLEDEINLDGIHITSFKSSHDAPDSRNYVFESDGKKLAYVTDTGYVNAKNFKYLKNLDIYLFESNHDIELLMNGPYPEWLKRRVYSDEGHLSNKTASFYLTKLVGDKTKKIVLIHLSETNNLESIAMETINNTFLDYGIDFHDIICAKQDEKTEVIEI